jgi:prolipoprotein diacylglyceryltransferase
MVWLGLVAGFYALQADLRRRRLPGDAYYIILGIAVAGLVGSKLYHDLEEPREFFAHPGMFFSNTGFAWFGAVLGGLLALWFFARRYRIPYLMILDVCAPAATLGYAIGRLGCLLSGDGDYGVPTSLPWGMSFPNGLVPTLERVHPTPVYECLAWLLIFYFLWREGRRAAQLQRPTGIVLSEYLILTGLARFLVEFIRINPRYYLGFFGPGVIAPSSGGALMWSNAQVAGLASITAGAALLAIVLPRFLHGREEHRILEHVAAFGEGAQGEWAPATPECRHPERWKMMDAQTAELEVLDFLRTLVTTVKPELIVETGTFMGISALRMAEGLKRNGFGKIITCESDPLVFAKAKERFRTSGLGQWIDARNQSSLETQIDGVIDILFTDSDPSVREHEVRRFLPQIRPQGLILMHDASSHFGVVREAALRLEAEGLISVALLPTPRGLVLAQKREGRS